MSLVAELLTSIRSAIDVLAHHDGDDPAVLGALEILADAEASATPPPADTATTPEPRPWPAASTKSS